ncbi:MAG: Hsp70 family protein, partial [Clostridia bacterium]|nr:Hsp70 family protein [Clostridia bacterium]
SDEDIEKAVKDAEKYAEEDKKRKEAGANKTHLESMLDNLEKTVKEAGDKLTDDDKKVVEDAVAKAKAELESNDNDRIKQAIETLSKDIQPVIAKIYQNAGGNPDGGNGGPEGGDTEFNQHS